MRDSRLAVRLGQTIGAGHLALAVVLAVTALATTGRCQEGKQAADHLRVGPTVIHPDLPYDSRPRSDVDAYGGWMGLKGNKTGFFHTERIGKRWWFITPEGHAYFALGLTMHAGHPAAHQKGWHASQVKRIRAWGFNCTQHGRHRPPTADGGVPYMLVFHLARSARPQLPLSYKPGLPPWTVFPDVFDPEWPARVQAEADKHLKGVADDPLLLGYFMDNELCLAGWYQGVMQAPPDVPARQAFVEVARRYYADNPAQLVEDWKKYDVKTVEDLARVKGPPPALPKLEVAWNRAVAERYFSVTAGACRKAAPNHLNLGVRLVMSVTTPPEVMAVMAKHCDVISLNLYSPWGDRIVTQAFTILPTVQALLKKPIMTSEFSYRGGDTAHPNTTGAPPTVPTQTDRGVGYLSYVSAMSAFPFYVGTVWFCYGDQRPAVRWHGYAEDCNFGIIDRSDRPYAVLTEVMRHTNGLIYELAAKPARNTLCPLFYRTEPTRWDLDWDEKMMKAYGFYNMPPDPMAKLLPARRRFHENHWVRHKGENLTVNDERVIGHCQANVVRRHEDGGMTLALIGTRGFFSMPRRLWLGEGCDRPDDPMALESNAQFLVRSIDKAGRVQGILMVDGSHVRTGLDSMDLRTRVKTPYLEITFNHEAKRLTVTTRGMDRQLGVRDVKGWDVVWNGKKARAVGEKGFKAPEGLAVFAPGE